MISVNRFGIVGGFLAQKGHRGRHSDEPDYPNIGVEPLPPYERDWRGGGRPGHGATLGAEALIRAGIPAHPHAAGTAVGTVEASHGTGHRRWSLANPAIPAAKSLRPNMIR